MALVTNERQHCDKKEYLIDFNNINTELDFYCLLGETFHGYKGYMGSDGNALRDCLSFIKKNNVENYGYKVVFKNFKRILDIFKNEHMIDEFKNKIFKDFTDYGFQLVT